MDIPEVAVEELQKQVVRLDEILASWERGKFAPSSATVAYYRQAAQEIIERTKAYLTNV